MWNSAIIAALAVCPVEGENGDDVTIPKTEADVYTTEVYPLPDGCVMEVGGMGFFSDGRLAVSTRRGQVWIVENPLAEDISESKVTLFHEGLWEGLGLSIVDDEIYVIQRGELSKLGDEDGDGRCDSITAVSRDWGVSGHYHEFAFGLPRDSKGNWWMGLNVSFGDPEWWHGRSTVPYRGWVLRVSPDGTVTPWAHGVRSPNGVAVDSKDRVFVTDNQGDWVASSPIYHIVEGGFYGHPKSLNWTDAYRSAGKLADDEIPPPEGALGRTPPAIWIPYGWSRSTGNLLEDTTGGKFGIPAGQFVVAELTNGMILRAGFEEVQGVTQGWVLPLRRKIGATNRVIQAADGTVICGLTERGWGYDSSTGPPDGLVRVRYTGAKALQFDDMHIVDGGEEGYGFELTFSQPLAEDFTPTTENCTILQYDYDYWWEYGSPERHSSKLEPTSLVVSEDRTKLTVLSLDLLPAMCVRIRLDGATAEGGAPLIQNEISYTINQFPTGPKTNAYVSKMVPPPPSRNNSDAGVLRLSWGDAMGQFESTGWELVDAQLADGDATRFATRQGNGALVNTGANASDYVTKGSFGDAHVHVEFMLPKNGSSGLVLPGLGTIDFTDNMDTCGTFGDLAPSKSGYTGAGQWHELDVFYRLGTEDAPAFLDRVVIGGIVLHEGVEITASKGARGPLRILGTKGPVALRNIQVKPLDRPSDDAEWTFLDVSGTWDDWDLSGDCNFELAGDELVGKGALGHLWSPESQLGEVTVRCRVKINANGAGAIVVNAQDSESGVQGTAIRVNASFADGALTGSVVSGATKAPLGTELIGADTWADLEIDVRNEEGGSHVTVSLNGVVVNDVSLDVPVRPGGLALRCDHDGTVFKVQNIRYRR